MASDELRLLRLHTCRSERLSEHTFGFEEEELKPYFALDNVLDGLFGV
jgi:Zn-dependent oligopeptidase